MVKVIANGKTIANSNETIVVEGNQYFPPSSLEKSFFTGSSTSTVCPWKGLASYYDAIIDGKRISDIAWYYPEPKDKASHIKGYVAFYKSKVSFQD